MAAMREGKRGSTGSSSRPPSCAPASDEASTGPWRRPDPAAVNGASSVAAGADGGGEARREHAASAETAETARSASGFLADRLATRTRLAPRAELDHDHAVRGDL